MHHALFTFAVLAGYHQGKTNLLSLIVAVWPAYYRMRAPVGAGGSLYWMCTILKPFAPCCGAARPTSPFLPLLQFTIQHFLLGCKTDRLMFADMHSSGC